MDPDKLRRYALVGAREEIKELLVGLGNLMAAFPRVASLHRAHEALVEALAALGAPGYTPPRPAKGPRREAKKPREDAPRVTPNGREPSGRTPTPTKPNGEPPESGAHYGALRSWLAGRDVLALLSSEPMDSGAIAKRLKLSRGTARWRLKVREGKGHVEQLDEAPDRWGITPEGREALKRDMENVPK